VPGKPDPDRLANSCGALKPRCTDAGKTGATAPLMKTGLHRRRQTVEQRRSAYVGPLGGNACCRKFGCVRMITAIHADADSDRDRVALAFDQNAADLTSRAQQVVGPFEGQPRRKRRRGGGDGIMKPEPGYEGKLRRHRRRRRIDQHQRRVEISSRRRPGPAAPSPSCALLPGYNPNRAALSGARAPKRFRIGGVDKVEDDDALPGGPAFIAGLCFRHSITDRCRRPPRRAVHFCGGTHGEYGVGSLDHAFTLYNVNCRVRYAAPRFAGIRFTRDDGLTETGLQSHRSKQRFCRNPRRLDERTRKENEQQHEKSGCCHHRPHGNSHRVKSRRRLIEIHDLDDQ
jgi:hypothetical protein